MFQVAVIAALHNVDIKSRPERISNLLRFDDNYNWSKLSFLHLSAESANSKRKMALLLTY